VVPVRDTFGCLHRRTLYPIVESPLKDKGSEHIDFVVVRENTGGIYAALSPRLPWLEDIADTEIHTYLKEALAVLSTPSGMTAFE
jgi:isocitrate/isopropylmalate dehydrogenase